VYLIYFNLQNSIQGSVNVGIAIGISTCARKNTPCDPASDGLFDVLFAGPYNPTLHNPRKPRYESFTVVIPTLPKGHAQLNVAYAGLFGVRSFFFLRSPRP
jgi:hypothetical protein